MDTCHMGNKKKDANAKHLCRAEGVSIYFRAIKGTGLPCKNYKWNARPYTLFVFIEPEKIHC